VYAATSVNNAKSGRCPGWSIGDASADTKTPRQCPLPDPLYCGYQTRGSHAINGSSLTQVCPPHSTPVGSPRRPGYHPKGGPPPSQCAEAWCSHSQKRSPNGGCILVLSPSWVWSCAGCQHASRSIERSRVGPDIISRPCDRAPQWPHGQLPNPSDACDCCGREAPASAAFVFLLPSPRHA
jgi:hypothetical protein